MLPSLRRASWDHRVSAQEVKGVGEGECGGFIANLTIAVARAAGAEGLQRAFWS